MVSSLMRSCVAASFRPKARAHAGFASFSTIIDKPATLFSSIHVGIFLSRNVATLLNAVELVDDVRRGESGCAQPSSETNGLASAMRALRERKVRRCMRNDD